MIPLDIEKGIEIWCNGSTQDFGSCSLGSNPNISTNIYYVNYVVKYNKLIFML